MLHEFTAQLQPNQRHFRSIARRHKSTARAQMRDRAGADLSETAAKTGESAADYAQALSRIASDGDQQAFELLFYHFAPRIKAYLMRLGAVDATADDLAQDTMAAVWAKAHLFDASKASAATWIFTIARNLRIDTLRRNRYITCSADILLELPDDDAVGADDAVVVVERDALLRQAIAALPQEQARVLTMNFFEDKTHMMIAEELGLPLGTVKSRVRLAMNRIRDALRVGGL